MTSKGLHLGHGRCTALAELCAITASPKPSVKGFLRFAQLSEPHTRIAAMTQSRGDAMLGQHVGLDDSFCHNDFSSLRAAIDSCRTHAINQSALRFHSTCDARRQCLSYINMLLELVAGVRLVARFVACSLQTAATCCAR